MGHCQDVAFCLDSCVLVRSEAMWPLYLLTFDLMRVPSLFVARCLG